MISLRHHALLILVLAVITPFYFAWTHTAELGQFGGDGPSYLMMAQHYSPYDAKDPVYTEAAAFSRFPPVYPLALAWLNGANDLYRAHAITTACLLAALLMLYVWLRGEEFAPQQSALFVLLCAVLPGSWIAGLLIQSEYLYLFWSLLALLAMAAYQRRGRYELVYVAAMAIAAATLTRTIGIALFAPFAVILWRTRRRIAVLAFIASVLPLLVWHLLHRSTLSYSEALTGIYSGEGLNFLRTQLTNELPALRRGLGDNFIRSETLRPFADALGLFCLCGAVWRAIKLTPDGLYVLGNLAILLVWPYPEEAQRFLWVITPLLVAQPVLAIAAFRQETPSSRPAQMLTGALALTILTMALPAFSHAAERYLSATEADPPNARSFVSWYDTDPVAARRKIDYQIAIITALRSIPTTVPATECVVSPRPDLMNYYGRRQSVAPPLNSVADPYFGKMIRATGCRYVFGYLAKDRRYPVPLHPLPRIRDESDIVFYTALPDDSTGKDVVICALARVK
jgi:hypothetical protein